MHCHHEQCLVPENKIFAFLKTQNEGPGTVFHHLCGRVPLFIATGHLFQAILSHKHHQASSSVAMNVPRSNFAQVTLTPMITFTSAERWT